MDNYTYADEDGDFLLSDGTLGNPGCDECGTCDADLKTEGATYLCKYCAEEKGIVPPEKSIP